MLWIRNGFNAYPDPAFYGTDPDSQHLGEASSNSWLLELLQLLAYTVEDSIQLKKSIRSRVLRPAFDLGAHQLSWVSLLYFLTQPFFCRFPMPWYMVT